MDQTIFSVFATIALIQFLGWLSPGPNLVAISSASMSAGRKTGIATALGIAAGVTCWATLAVGGIALLFQTVPALFVALKFSGALFLCWMGYQSLSAAMRLPQGQMAITDTPPELGRAFRNGFLVLMTNPKAPIFFGAILTSFLPVDAPNWVFGGIVLEFLLLSALLNSITAIVFSTKPVMNWFASHQRHLRIFFGLIYLALGLWVLKDLWVPA